MRIKYHMRYIVQPYFIWDIIKDSVGFIVGSKIFFLNIFWLKHGWNLRASPFKIAFVVVCWKQLLCGSLKMVISIRGFSSGNFPCCSWLHVLGNDWFGFTLFPSATVTFETFSLWGQLSSVWDSSVRSSFIYNRSLLLPKQHHLAFHASGASQTSSPSVCQESFISVEGNLCSVCLASAP